jgi:predicted Fe-Mo cluster-binding NifX family protein
MKLLLSADENKLSSKLALRFENSSWYCIYDSNTDTHEFIKNTDLSGNNKQIGISTILFLKEKGIRILVSKRFETRCIETFKKHYIQLVVPQKSKTIKDIIHLIGSNV